MKKRVSIREHVLDMMMYFNIAEVNGGPIDEANQFQTLTLVKEKVVEANVATTKKKCLRRLSSNKVGPSKPKAQMKKKGKEEDSQDEQGKERYR
ncbi:gag/pol protein [Cucumis melo var. makuwa]|uniref:Gag/pol protein n=1 Tax=Cucumis melo var. makuwa TaxID=1194695 RepID=A0A5D3DYA0_CUCMM|nr:gag/pol protein [Cucumis melo var. makuwa]TYK28315.1 gag/pol protein [Cucumis melo var. makuwa]